MADWKEMYLKMFRASEKAMRILEAAQLECEEMYMRDGDEEAEQAEREEEAKEKAEEEAAREEAEKEAE